MIKVEYGVVFEVYCVFEFFKGVSLVEVGFVGMSFDDFGNFVWVYVCL